MHDRNMVRQPQPWAQELFCVPEDDGEVEDCRLWCKLNPSVVCDAFESNHETLEPDPEYGDFWAELDDEALI